MVLFFQLSTIVSSQSILRKSNENKLGGLLRELGLEDRIVDSVDNLSEILEKILIMQKFQLYWRKSE